MPRPLPAAFVAVLASLIAITGCTQPQPAGELTIPTFDPIYGSRMVLPHGVSLTLTGDAVPGQRLTLEVDGVTYDSTADDAGRWQIGVAPLAAGGPYELAIRDRSGMGEALEDVLAGEIWLCSGQSNMAFSVARSIDQPAEYNAGSAAIRLLKTPQRTALEPQDAFETRPAWQLATDESVPNFSAVCYFAARRMLEANGVPLGLINASWGGSAIEAWVSEAGLANVPAFRRAVQGLATYRTDRRAAELAFAADWVAWWDAHADQGHVWAQGVLDGSDDWREAPLVDWNTYPDERLLNHYGLVWFSTSFELSEAQAGMSANFVLGKIDEVDTTWVNGKFLNNTFGYGDRREYPLVPGMLVPGVNQITVNVLNTWASGGMLGPAEDVGIRFANNTVVSLGDSWQYRFIPRSTGEPPRSPWETVAGIAGMFNGMIAPLRPLTPAGVIWYQGESSAAYSERYQVALTALVADWRQYFNAPELPFVVVQLPNFGPVNDTPGPSGWAAVRHAQQQVALADDRVGLVVTHDVGNDADIHPQQKFVVGTRVAEVAAALAGDGGVEDGVVASIGLNGQTTLVLDFSPPLALTGEPELVEGFILCDRTGADCVTTIGSQTGSRVAVELGPMPDAERVRFCWSDGGQCSLTSINGLPVSSFELVRDAIVAASDPGASAR